MKLVRMSKDRFQWIDSNVRFEGTLQQVRNYIVESVEVTQSEFEHALDDMYSRGNDTAHFGINRTFIYSSKSCDQQRLMMEFKAVLDLRAEFHREHKRDRDSDATKNAFNRLMSLYMSLNVDAALDVLRFMDKAA